MKIRILVYGGKSTIGLNDFFSPLLFLSERFEGLDVIEQNYFPLGLLLEP